MTVFKKLRGHFSDIKNLGYIYNLLSWDQQVYMPEGGNKGRSELIVLIRKIAHNKLISNKTKKLISEAEQFDELDLIDTALLREAKKDYEKAIRVPTELVEKIAKNSTLGHKAWEKAHKKSDFSIFKPYLEEMIELQKQYADCIDMYSNRYDNLLDDYEPGATSQWIAKLFNDLRYKLTKILDKLTASDDKPNQSILTQYYAPEKQWEFCLEIIKHLNFGFNQGRLDKSVHPFTTSISSCDVRITTRIMNKFLPSCIFGTIHECGHALYELGFMENIQSTHLANACSMGFHESQSRLWENMVGRSKEFWQDFWYPTLQKYFPDNLKGFSAAEFYRSINTIQPSLIRVEADELTYSLHIVLRFELEKMIFEDKIRVSELPQVWNQKTEELLGILPDNDAEGILQDVHWSGGAFGYFPTYSLGNLYAAQIFSTAQKKIPHLSEKLSNGNYNNLLKFLREEIHQYGKVYPPRKLIQKVTGEPLSPSYFLAYLKDKFFPMYGIEN